VSTALLLSPLVDMTAFIRRRLVARHLTEDDLRSAGVIAEPQGQDLTWEYFSWARDHPPAWTRPCRVLWGRRDDLVPAQDIDGFAAASGAIVETIDAGHAFGPEHDEFVTRWIEDGLVASVSALPDER
jgi:pimeloyl-ACP methyl ester carboxylesterase